MNNFQYQSTKTFHKKYDFAVKRIREMENVKVEYTRRKDIESRLAKWVFDKKQKYSDKPFPFGEKHKMVEHTPEFYEEERIREYKEMKQRMPFAF